MYGFFSFIIHILVQLLRQAPQFIFPLNKLSGKSSDLRHRTVIGQSSFHSKSLFLQLIEKKIVLFKSFGRTLELAFLVVGVVVKLSVKALHIAFGVLYAVFLCPFSLVNVAAFLTAKVGIVGFVLDYQLSADSTVRNYAVSLFEHINVNAENGKERVIGNIGCLPSAVKVRIIDMYRQIGGRSVYLFGNVPIPHIRFGYCREITKRQEHIRNTSVELLRKASRFFYKYYSQNANTLLNAAANAGKSFRENITPKIIGVSSKMLNTTAPLMNRLKYFFITALPLLK